MSDYKISVLKSKKSIATITTSSFCESSNDASCLIKISNVLDAEFDIKRKELNNLQLYELTILKILMNLPEIRNENDYQTCVHDAHTIEPSDKIFFCPNFYYVFYAELEINLNRCFTRNSREQWSLLFVDYNFMPPVNVNNNNFNRRTPVQIFRYEPHILTILHNAKIKYRCLNCGNEWATARGRAIFQAEIPEINKHNVLFGYLFTQKCQICRQDTEPSWYLDEATRVMKNVCRILIEQFYPHRQFLLSPSSSSSSDEDDTQRTSYMRNHHHRDLCRACQEGSCYG